MRGVTARQKLASKPPHRIAELVIGPATSGWTRWQSDLSPHGGDR